MDRILHCVFEVNNAHAAGVFEIPNPYPILPIRFTSDERFIFIFRIVMQKMKNQVCMSFILNVCTSHCLSFNFYSTDTDMFPKKYFYHLRPTT